MKYMKKLASLLLALVMVFALGVSAFAANTNEHTITITNDKSGHTYTAYQVFSGDITGGKLTNIAWGSGVNGDAVLTALKALDNSPYANCEDAMDVAGVLAGFANDSEQLDAFAKVVGKNLGTEAGHSSESASPYTIKVFGDGYYFVKDTGTLGSDDAATKYILEVLDDVSIKAKAETPTIDKIIVNADDGKGNGTAVDVGSVVTFQLTSTVPAMEGYDSYTYIVNDTMSAGLTPVDEDNDGIIDVTVTIGGNDYADFTVVQNGQSFTITFNNFINQKANAGKEIVITYSATLNENALNTDKETNTVYLEYSNDPNNSSSTGQTPPDIVYVYDFDIVIDKFTDDKTGEEKDTRLANAKFVLLNSDKSKYYYYNETTKAVEWNALAEGETLEGVLAVDYTGDTKITEVTTGENGAAKFQGLDTGTYYLHETAAPAGYNVLTEDVEVVITATYKDDGTIDTSSATSTSNGQYQQTEPVENRAGSLLPSTGGIGTTIFYILGGLLVAGAVVLLVTKRRMNAEG